MINNSVSIAYSVISNLAEQVEKAEVEGIPKQQKVKTKKEGKKGLLSRSNDMNKYSKQGDTNSNQNDFADKQQQKLVIAYMLRIKKAFEEVKTGRTTNTKS